MQEVQDMLVSVESTFVAAGAVDTADATDHRSGTHAGGVAVMGSMPPGCPPDLYASIISKSCDQHSKVCHMC